MDCPVCKTERLSMMERQGIKIDYFIPAVIVGRVNPIARATVLTPP